MKPSRKPNPPGDLEQRRPVLIDRVLRACGITRSPAEAGPLGARGERAAERYLRNAGYRILSRNLRLPMGEIDLLALSPDRGTIVVVEVKARMVCADDADRLPERAITAAKGRKLASLAQAVVRRRGAGSGDGALAVRIDVVAVDFMREQRGPTGVRHYPNAIGADGRRV